MEEFTLLEKITGYFFKNHTLLNEALTHSSYANELQINKLKDNERLEFLGDAVLELSVSDFLFNRYKDIPEGKLTKKRASIVCEQTLFLCAKKINLGDFLMLGKGEDLSGGRRRPSVVSDAMEALIGAIYLDGGFESADAFIKKHILSYLPELELFFDSKTSLQEIVQSMTKDPLTYVLIGEEGPDHDKHFKTEVKIGDKVIAVGDGHTKKASEQEAAYKAILVLKKTVN